MFGFVFQEGGGSLHARHHWRLDLLFLLILAPLSHDTLKHEKPLNDSGKDAHPQQHDLDNLPELFTRRASVQAVVSVRHGMLAT